MAKASSTVPAPAGVWTTAVVIAWLRTLGMPAGFTLVRGPRMPRGVDRVVRVTASSGARGGPSAGDEVLDSWKGFQLAWRGPQRAESDEEAEAAAQATHQRVIRAPTGVWLPAGTGRLWMPRDGLSWPSGGPSPLTPVPDDAERFLWTCNYLMHVIEHPTLT